MISGIYIIVNIVNNKYYIGSTNNISLRWMDHKTKLNRNRHSNKYLQAAWHKHGKDNFNFYVLEHCSIDKLIEREQFWINKSKCCNKEYGYNINPIAESFRGVKQTDEHRAKIGKGNRKLNKWPCPDGAWCKCNACSEYRMKIDRNRRPDKYLRTKSEAHRKPDKWPHEDGMKCKCVKCSTKWNEYRRNYLREYRRKKRAIP